MIDLDQGFELESISVSGNERFSLESAISEISYQQY